MYHLPDLELVVTHVITDRSHLVTASRSGSALEAYLDHRNIQHTVRCRVIANAVQEFLARVRGSACCLEASSYGRVSMLKDKTFTYRGHTFQVRATLLEKGWAVQAMSMRNQSPRHIK